jgi:zinc protease
MRNKILTACCVALSCLSAFNAEAQYEADKKLPLDENVKVGRLPNGLTYYIRKNAVPAKKVQLRLVVNTGSVLENPDQQGLAHFMEHMNFNGLKHFPKNELVSYLQSIGVQFGSDLNAYTSFDETVYFLPIPVDDPEKLEKGFTILEDWAFNALLDPEEINKERGVVLEESRLSKGAQDRMSKKYYPILFNGSDYSKRLPIGKDSILQSFTPDKLISFYKTWYRPDLISVIVVGDIDPAVAEQKIMDHFAAYKNPPGEKLRTIAEIAPRAHNESLVVTDKEQPTNRLEIYNYAEKSKPVTTWGDYRRSVAENLFNVMIGQRLAEIAQKPDAPFLAAGTNFGNFVRGYRTFSAIAILGDKPAKNAVEALIGTVESVKKYGFLPSELQRAKISLMTGVERAYNDRDKTESIRMLQEYQNNFLENTPMVGIGNRYNFLKATLPAITVEEVNAVAKRAENNQGFFALLTGSEKSAASLPANDELTALITTAKSVPPKAFEEKAIASSLMEKAPVAGKIMAEKKDAALGTTELTLSNGITVTLKPTDFKNDEIHMDSWRQGGTHNYPLADKLNAERSHVLVRAMGIKDMSSIDLRKFMAGKTVSVTPYMNANDEGIEGNTSGKDMETFFQLIYLYFTQPRKDPAIFQSYIAGQKAQMKNIKDNPNAFFADTLGKVIFSNNPWATTFYTPEMIDQINLDRSMEIYKEVFGNAYGIHFTFVGNVDVEKIKPFIATYLASLPASPKNNHFTDVKMRPVKGIVELNVKKGAAKQSFVNVIFNGEAKYSKEEELKLDVLAEILTIKATEKLREEMGGVYYGNISASMVNRPYNSYSITARFPCGPENVDKLVAATFELLKNIREKGIDQKDLDKVKEKLRKDNEEQLKNNDYWLSTLSYAFIENYDPKWILNYESQVNALTAADIQKTAQKYLDMKNYVKAVLNPE